MDENNMERKKKNSDKETVAVVLGGELFDELQRLADTERRPRASMVRVLLEEAIKSRLGLEGSECEKNRIP